MVDVGIEKVYPVSEKLYLGEFERAKTHFRGKPDKPSPSPHQPCI
jgi:hypothetical protein